MQCFKSNWGYSSKCTIQWAGFRRPLFSIASWCNASWLAGRTFIAQNGSTGSNFAQIF